MNAHRELVDRWLEGHAQECERGARFCVDCALSVSGEYRSTLALAIAIANETREAMRHAPDACTYCGAWADSVDHLLPKGWTGKAARVLVGTVPACRDCNSRIGDLPDPWIHARAAVAASSLRRKWATKLDYPDRTPAELRSFGPRIRSRLEASQIERDNVRRRLAVLDVGGVPYLPEYSRRRLA